MSCEVSVDDELCISSGKCVAAAPGFFAFDGDEIATVDPDGLQPADDVVLRIARACPSEAIQVTIDGVPVEL